MTRRLLFLFALAILLAGGFLVSNQAVADVATMSAAGGTVLWSPLIEYERLELSVSGNGRDVRLEFAAGESPVFDLTGADGGYKWELRATPKGVKLERGRDQAPAGAAPLVQSGHFFVRDGAVVDSTVAEAAPAAGGPAAEGAGPIVPADQVILDDLIVNGSACVGQDCVNGESFGFDTLRLKENNLRIKFQDTSTSASFPTNDWQITANDSSNGGLNKFSIDDIDGGRTPFTIEAGARSNALYVEADGDIGIGTNNPVVNIEIKEGNTPTIRLCQDGSSGFTPQAWDIAGNEANFFIRDVTNGSKLPFQIKPGAPTASIFIEASGDVGIGTSSPGPRLHVKNGNIKVGETDEATTRNIRISNDQVQWLLQNSGSDGSFTIRNATSGFTPFEIEAGAPANLMTLTAANGVEVSGAQVHPPDFVFEPDYDLMPIADHADYMWSNKHLPAVGKGRYNEDGDATIAVLGHSFGMLEELEVAHIYIAQLNDAIEERDTKIEALEERLARIEALLQASE